MQQINMANNLDNKVMDAKHQKDYQEYQKYLDLVNSWTTTLDLVTKQKNILTEREFAKYAPLYRSSKVDPANRQSVEESIELRMLSKEFFDRINPYEEITIIDNLENKKVIAVLPKIYMKVDPIKAGKESAITEFDTKTNVPFRKDLHEQGVNALLGAIVESQELTYNPSLKQIEREKFLNRAKELLGIQEESNKLNNTTSKYNTEKKVSSVSVDDMEFDE